MKKILSAILMAASTAFPAQSQDVPDDKSPQQVSLKEMNTNIPPLTPKTVADFMDITISAQMQALDIPSATVSVVKDGKVIFANAYGKADISKDKPATANETLFRPGSISKLFTWVAVMQQVEEGKIDLNVDINRYLKNFQIPSTFDEPITMAHILTHTAGFEEGALGYLLVTDPDKAIPLEEAMVKYLPRRINSPGAYSAYSNYATALAGLIVQNVSGLSFNDYIAQRILEPLGMNNSTFVEPLPPQLLVNYANGYKREMGAYTEQPFEIITSFGPAGALSSTASDMAKFMLANLNGGRFDDSAILSPETTELMHSVLFAPDKRISGMAHGFYEEIINGHRLIGHGGDTTLFHSNLLLDKSENLGIFVSYMGKKGGQARSELPQAFYDRFYPRPLKKLTPPSDFNERAGQYAGKYKFWRHNQSTLEKAMALSGGITVTPTKNNTLLVSGLGEPRQYAEIDTNLFRQLDGHQKIVFANKTEGQFKNMYLDGMTFMSASRVPFAENSLFTQTLPLLSFLVFVSVWTGWVYRRQDYKVMQTAERRAIKLSMSVSGLNILFLLSLVAILSIYKEQIIFNIPTALKIALVLPDLASLLALGVLWHAVQSWRQSYWRTGRRIHYTVVSACAIFMSWFYYYWNFWGIQFS